jgi:hypothetical protein
MPWLYHRMAADNMKTVLWTEYSSLYLRTVFDNGTPRERAFFTGPLNWLVQLAVSGAEGPLENLFIRTESGRQFDPREILELSHLPDRPTPVPQAK